MANKVRDEKGQFMRGVKKIIKEKVAKFLFGIGMIFMGLAIKVDKSTIGNFMLTLIGVSAKGKLKKKDEGEEAEKD